MQEYKTVWCPYIEKYYNKIQFSLVMTEHLAFMLTMPKTLEEIP